MTLCCTRSAAAALIVCVLLSACGGGGGGSGSASSATGGGDTGGSTDGGGSAGSASGGTDTGGSTGGVTPPVDPFGLESRPPLASLSLPSDPVALGSYELEESFPDLGGFPQALFLAGVPGSDRMAVVEQTGQIHAFTDDPAVSSSRLVLDVSASINSGGEEGLLGLAFDPDFISNRYIYVHYSAGSPRRSVIARFRWDEATDLIQPASEKLILEVPQPFANHNGGMLAFGPDGMLYIAFGDGGSAGDPQNNAQNPGNFLGSIVRLDVHPANPSDSYDVPADNPFIGVSGFLPETYAYGLRNPFRFSFDRQSGELWLGDVGQNEREEINLVSGGENFGWRVYEGSLPYDNSANSLPDSAFTPPLIDYDHGQGLSVIGGYVYRGAANAGLVGRYLYTDFLSGPVWALEYVNGQVLSNAVIANASSSTKSFGEDNDGEVHMLVGSRIHRFVETVNNGGDIPNQLSETGIFTALSSLTPASGLIEYELNAPFWSDNAIKRRWVAVPDAAQITFSASESFTFPPGSLLVKHFEMLLEEDLPSSAKRLETRLLVNTVDGWQGFTYRWNDDESDALLLSGRESEVLSISVAGGGSREQLYEYPSRTDCLICHNDAAGFALGLEARQQNRQFDYPAATDNQLRSWNHIAYFTSDIGDAGNYDEFPRLTDSAAAVTERARVYLHVNCASCHQPGGPTPVTLDLRVDTPLADTGALNVLPSAGDLGIADARIIAPGASDRSTLWQRMRVLNGDRMPPLSSHLVDRQGVELIGSWIDSL